jgi:hypothetical protein
LVPRSGLLGHISLGGFGTLAASSLTGYYFAWLIVQPPGFCQDVSQKVAEFEQAEAILQQLKKCEGRFGSAKPGGRRSFYRAFPVGLVDNRLEEDRCRNSFLVAEWEIGVVDLPASIPGREVRCKGGEPELCYRIPWPSESTLVAEVVKKLRAFLLAYREDGIPSEGFDGFCGHPPDSMSLRVMITCSSGCKRVIDSSPPAYLRPHLEPPNAEWLPRR